MTHSSDGFTVWERFETLCLERCEDLARITLNRPEKLNALNRQAWRELPEAVRVACCDPAIAAIILTGAGRGFCSGADADDMLTERLARPPRVEIPEPAGREW